MFYFFLRQVKGVNYFRIKILFIRLGYSYSHLFNSFDKQNMASLLDSYYVYGSYFDKLNTIRYDIFSQKKNYKSFRFLEFKPIRGQRTKTNAQSARRIAKNFLDVHKPSSEKSKQR